MILSAKEKARIIIEGCFASLGYGQYEVENFWSILEKKQDLACQMLSTAKIDKGEDGGIEEMGDQWARSICGVANGSTCVVSKVLVSYVFEDIQKLQKTSS